MYLSIFGQPTAVVFSFINICLIYFYSDADAADLLGILNEVFATDVTKKAEPINQCVFPYSATTVPSKFFLNIFVGQPLLDPAE